jgi:hypothetical protein
MLVTADETEAEVEANAFLDYLNESPATSALAESLAAIVDTRRASRTRHRVRRPARVAS